MGATATIAEDEAGTFFAPDRVRGAVVGAVLGDMIGSQADIRSDSRENVASVILVMRTLTSYFTGSVSNPVTDFAARISQWHQIGFPELGEAVGLCSRVTALAVNQTDFVRDPIRASRMITGPKAENGALVRAVVCAFTVAPAEWAALFCETTHADNRCVASARTLALLVCRLAQAEGVPAEVSLTTDYLDGAPARRADYLRKLAASNRIEDVGLTDQPTYVLKTLACATWAFRQLTRAESSAGGLDAGLYKTALDAIIGQGGSIRTNCAVAGAVLGASLGYTRLPGDWLEFFPDREWVLDEIENFLAAAEPTWK